MRAFRGIFSFLPLLTLLLPVPGSADEPLLKIGLIAALHGPAAPHGQAAKNGLSLALEEDIRSGRLNLFIEDDAGDPKLSVSAFNKLTKIDQADLVLTVFSGPSNAVAPLAERERIPLIALAGDPAASRGRNYVIRARSSGEREGLIIGKAMAGLVTGKTGMICAQNDFTLSVCDGVKKELRNRLVLEEEAAPAEADFRPFLAKVKANGIQTLFVGLLPGRIGLFARQSRELQTSPQLFGGVFFESRDEVAEANGGLEGAVYLIQNPSKEFGQRYLAVHPGDSSLTYASIFYDLGNMIRERAAPKEELLAALKKLRGYRGVTGTYNYRNDNGDSYFEDQFVLKQIKNGSFELLDKRKVAEKETSFAIGVSTALTGSSATYGQDIRDAVLYANEILAGGRHRFVFEDDKCVGRDAASAAHKLLGVDHVDAVMGFACSGAAFAAAPIYEAAKMPVVLAMTSSPQLAAAGDYIFRTFPSAKTGVDLLARYAAAKTVKTAVLSEETDFAQDIFRAFQSSYRAAADKTLASESFPPDTSDFRTVLMRMKKDNTGALFINAQSEAGFYAVLKQVREMAWTVSLYGAYWPASPSLLEKAQADLEGVVFFDTPALDEVLTDSGRGVYLGFKERYGKPRSIEAAFATTFEAFRALTLALESGSDVKQFLYRSSFDGLFGPYHFDSNGEIVGISFVLKTIKDGRVVTLR